MFSPPALHLSPLLFVDTHELAQRNTSYTFRHWVKGATTSVQRSGEEAKGRRRHRTPETMAAKCKAESVGFGYANIIEATQDIEGLTYRPLHTTQTRQVYDLTLAAVRSSIGDQAQDIVRSAADTVLEVLKTNSLKDSDKKEIESVLGTLPNERFSQLVCLSRKSPTTMLTTKPWVILTRRWRLTRRVELPSFLTRRSRRKRMRRVRD